MAENEEVKDEGTQELPVAEAAEGAAAEGEAADAGASADASQS
jgi:hypothetical protein